ncbi:MerR family transcriptional regulator [Actinophytocola oryzae]|uniref:DNA-binding transcriptional MerR regulator n=1 Tax=Actinophytocola oryzae TaxID=502181 RepID=A0A4R7VCJ2_9PSEU|nr:MerR family transcriptional regulator [Actinophytocola oryzae]TDV46826.1 DNA-binding transcriptional MerR regulator [Actinophytocola oryzae]
MMSSIGEVAERFGVAPHVLRHWESMGVLSPARDETGRRRYDDADLSRVALILMSREAGLGLRQLREFLSGGDQNGVLRRHLAVLRRRIAQAEAAKELVEHALSCPASFEECPHAREQIAARIPPGSPVRRSREIALTGDPS